MSDVNHVKIDDVESISGVLEGVTFIKAAPALGVEAFGISIVDIDAGSGNYPEHDHDPEGAGGKMFAKRPAQLGQEEVYAALRGSGTFVADGEEFPLDPGHAVRVGPAVVRKVVPGPEGIRLLIVGGRPGEAYEPG